MSVYPEPPSPRIVYLSFTVLRNGVSKDFPKKSLDEAFSLRLILREDIAVHSEPPELVKRSELLQWDRRITAVVDKVDEVD